MEKAITLLFSLACVATSQSLAVASSDIWPELKGPYVGQAPPGMMAELFAPGIISTEGSEINSAFSPGQNEFYYTTWTAETGTRIMLTRQVGGHWLEPVQASFSTHPTDVDPVVSPDGQRLIFASRRPRPGETADREGGFDLWFARRVENGWGEAEFMGPVVNSGASQVYATLTRDHTMYFQAVREGGYGKADIHRARLINGQHQVPENLGAVINSENYEGDVFIDPDENYLVVSISGRADDTGAGDLYVSFRDQDDSWTPLKNMGDAVNTTAREFCPMVTPDGKYLFFSSKRRGDGDIFWIDANIIETLRD